MGVGGFLSILHVTDRRLAFIVAGFSPSIDLNDSHTRDGPLGIVGGFIIAGQGSGAAETDEDIMTVRGHIYQVWCRVLIPLRGEIDRADAEIRERVNNLNVVAGPIRAPYIAPDRGHAVR